MRQKITENRMIDAFNDYALMNNIVSTLYVCGFDHISAIYLKTWMICRCFCDSEEEAQQAYDIMKRVTGDRGEYKRYSCSATLTICDYIEYTLEIKNRFEDDDNI